MQIHPTLFLRGIAFVVAFVVFASILLGQTTPGAAEAQFDKKTGADVQVETEACPISRAYPDEVRQWCPWITQYAREYDLPPDLIAALIWYESGGNPTAYSRSGAVGLMQVMPRDGLAEQFMCPNGPCFANRPTRAELEDPRFNIEYGTRMLAGLRNRFQDLREALKAYGPANVGYQYADKVLAIYERYGED